MWQILYSRPQPTGNHLSSTSQPLPTVYENPAEDQQDSENGSTNLVKSNFVSLIFSFDDPDEISTYINQLNDTDLTDITAVVCYPPPRESAPAESPRET